MGGKKSASIGGVEVTVETCNVEGGRCYVSVQGRGNISMAGGGAVIGIYGILIFIMTRKRRLL